MKTYSFLFLVLFLLPASVSAQYYTNDDLPENEYVGKWQEYQRTDFRNRSEVLDFTDTLQLQIMPDSMVRIWYTDGRYFNEPYFFDKKGLHFGELFVFKKYRLNKDELSLRNDRDLHYFKRVDKLQQGAIKKRLPSVEKGEVNATASTIIGKWSSYKKEDPAFTGKTFYLRTINITEDKGDGVYAGSVSYANMIEAKVNDATLIFSGNELEVKVQGQRIKYEILKLEGATLTLSRDGAVLYFKEFGR